MVKNSSEFTIGLWTLALDSVHVREAAQLVREVEELGYSTLWFGEVTGREAFTNAGVYLAATTHLLVGTGIASIYGRDPTAANAAARTLNDAHSDRFILGLGVSHRPLVERIRQQHYASPVQTMSDYLAATGSATFTAPGSIKAPVTVIAALGPRMLEISRAQSDGALTYLSTPEHTFDAGQILGADKTLAVEQAVVFSTSREYALQCAHTYLNFYTGLSNYRNHWLRYGFNESDFIRGGSERLAEAMVVWGDETTIRERIEQHRSAGATHVCLQFLGGLQSDICADDWRRFAPIATSLINS